MVAPHAPLITALTTFYSLLVELQFVGRESVPEPVMWPSPETGRHGPHTTIAGNVAKLLGFSDAAVDLALRIPHLAEDDAHAFLYPQVFEMAKERAGQGWGSRDVLLLTISQVYGAELVYDLETESLRTWEDFHAEQLFGVGSAGSAGSAAGQQRLGEDDSRSKWHPMTVEAGNPLYRWIRELLTLHDEALTVLERRLLPPWDAAMVSAVSYGDWSVADQHLWDYHVVSYKAKRDVADVYVEHGWNPNVLEDASEGNEGGDDDQDGTREHSEDKANVAVWENLELARQRASRYFRRDEFTAALERWRGGVHERRRREWEEKREGPRGGVSQDTA